MDRVTEIEYSNGNTIQYAYDANGNQTSRTDSVHGSSSWQYDELNRRAQDTLPSRTNTYTWDAASNLSSLTDPGGTVTYRYDDANRLQDLAEPGGSCTGTVSLCTTFGYTNRDQRETTTYPNGVVQTVTYDSSDKPPRVRAVKGANLLTDFTYTFNVTTPVLRETVLRRTVTDKDGNTTIYGYDPVDRLMSAIEQNSGGTTIDTRTWTYDNASNRETQVSTAPPPATPTTTPTNSAGRTPGPPATPAGQLPAALLHTLTTSTAT